MASKLLLLSAGLLLLTAPVQAQLMPASYDVDIDAGDLEPLRQGDVRNVTVTIMRSCGPDALHAPSDDVELRSVTDFAGLVVAGKQQVHFTAMECVPQGQQYEVVQLQMSLNQAAHPSTARLAVYVAPSGQSAPYATANEAEASILVPLAAPEPAPVSMAEPAQDASAANLLAVLAGVLAVAFVARRKP